jgi:inorganic pyrophosphatase
MMQQRRGSSDRRTGPREPSARSGPRESAARARTGQPAARTSARATEQTERHGRRSERSADAFPDVIDVVVEIPSGSRNKIEYDERSGVYRLDRVLSSAVFYNFEYGYIEGTRAGDGDHDDAMVLLDEPTFTGCHVWARPVGGLEMRDEKGEDFKVLCVALGDPLYAHVDALGDVSPNRLREIEHFFATYKLLEDKRVEVSGWRDRNAALKLLRADRARWESERAAERSRA